MRIIKTVCGFMGAMALVTVITAGCGETRDDDAGSGGKGGELDCQVLSLGSGGAIYLDNCPQWFAQGGEGGTATESLCAAEGEGGGAGTEPALALACAKVESIQFEQHLVKCLQPLAEDLCADDHDQKVRACFAAKKPCGAEIEECGPLSAGCSSLSPGLCYWGMSEAKARERDDELTSCFAEPRQGESCDDTFFRCAWGL
jgi:hypothetical protein